MSNEEPNLERLLQTRLFLIMCRKNVTGSNREIGVEEDEGEVSRSK